jgi:predicted SAM-dependent methyltransferase
MKPTRLQLGASRLEHLPLSTLRYFLDKSWVHLGDAPDAPSPLKRLVRRIRQLRRGIPNTTTLYERTNFQPFYYRKGEDLPFDDSSINFVFSEHFFEHLFFDESIALFRECWRVIKLHGVLRVSVPDADLRTYEAPERAGYPSRRLPFTHPNKHKTRWSIYLLSEALGLCGFEVRPLRYCDRDGRYIQNQPEQYGGCPETQLVSDLGYLRRSDSLIVDGIKR